VSAFYREPGNRRRACRLRGSTATVVGFLYRRLAVLGGRSTVGHRALDAVIGVRIPASQPAFAHPAGELPPLGNRVAFFGRNLSGFHPDGHRTGRRYHCEHAPSVVDARRILAPLMTLLPPVSRRMFVRTAALAAAALATPSIVRAQRPVTLRFRTIPDPDGWHPTLRLKGDWLVVELSDGVLSGYGEASHSNDDERCKQALVTLFARHYTGFEPSLENLALKEREIARLKPDLVTATAFSALNQAFYDLLAKREQVPVWRLFREKAPFAGVPLYTTINRSLQTRSAAEYSTIVGEVRRQGFTIFKCAPFEAVNGPDDAVPKSAAGLATLQRLREEFPDLGIRVDFHERFQRRGTVRGGTCVCRPSASHAAAYRCRRAVLGRRPVCRNQAAPLGRRDHARRETRRRVRTAARRHQSKFGNHRGLAAQSRGTDIDRGEPACGGHLPRCRADARILIRPEGNPAPNW
jgi:hypothetical protein